MISRSLMIAAGLTAMLAGAAQAHHSIGGEFDAKNEVTVQGLVREFHLINPHSYIVLEVMQEDGQSVVWTLSFGPATKLVRGSGWTPTTLTPGDHITATGRLARQGHGMYVVELTDERGESLIKELQE